MYAMLLESKRIRTCPMQEVDFNKYLGWLNDPEVTKYLTTVKNGITSKGARQYIDRMDASNSDVLFAIVDRAQDRFIGTAHFNMDWTKKEGNFGVMIGDKSYWGQGFGTEVFELMTYYGIVVLFLKRLIVGADSRQVATSKCMHRCGYKRIKGAEDTQMYEMTQKQYLKLHPSYVNDIPIGVYRARG